MSRRSRKSGSAITLFFFQDIIMSTSGIMIMIVLLLCLELIERPELSAAASKSPVQQLQEQGEELQEEIKLLEQKIATTTELIQSAAQMSSSERNEQIEHLQTANNLLVLEMERLQAELNRHEIQEVERNIQRQELKQMRDQVEAAEREQAKIANEIQDESRENRPLFFLSRGDRREGWIVDVSASRIQVAPIGKTEKPRSFTASRKGFFQSERVADAFLEWRSSNAASSNSYYFLFVRPDGVENFAKISESFNKTRVSYGYDITDSKTKLLHPERGAGE
ncbi:hypothetical protein [Planctomicrobium sp. SH527]|uniref:hypothetical protein n=1 Tax=Planctomicrobium sp. SH527 TaxID=3448123 RepID=UPI003F5B1A43